MTSSTAPTETSETYPLQVVPKFKQFATCPDIMQAFKAVSHLPGCLLLESARDVDPSVELVDQSAFRLSRYSFLLADPVATIVEPVGADDAFSELRKLMGRFELPEIEGLPPMQGGVAGLFSYDLNQSIEKVNPARHDEFQLPAMALGVYDVVVAWDHALQKAWIVSLGLDGALASSCQRRAFERMEFFENIIAESKVKTANRPPVPSSTKKSLKPSSQFETDGPERVTSDFSAEGYHEAVAKCIDYIHAGDAFQINLSQRLLVPSNCNSFELYQRLRQTNPAPFGGYFDLAGICDCDAQIISSSPERFFAVRNGKVETRPIKGTRRRTHRPMVDIHARDQLVSSEKDRAENTMIVDLMRNDLSKVCLDDSIQVTQYCELEEYESVIHLVSAVEGELCPENDLVDLLVATFPGGSITGAPKIRAMEIIAELEPTARGAYCGSLGYLGFNGNADLSILIRTVTASQGWWQIPVGGGIVSQSQPQIEYDETWAKATGMLRAVTMDGQP